jgi:hypothetical protein
MPTAAPSRKADTTNPPPRAQRRPSWVTAVGAFPLGQVGAYNFEVGALTREIAEGYEKLVRS